MNNIHLSNRTIIEISGVDRKKFLQGLITNDINQASDSTLLYAAMLNAQGRFLYDFFIFEKEEKLFLDCYKPRVDEIIKKLSFYKLRSQIVLKKNEEMQVISSEEKIADDLCFIDPRNIKMGYRSYMLQQAQHDQTGNTVLDENYYHYLRITNKIPEGEYDLTYEKSFILEFNFDNLNAVNYNKGCYVGQEPTARIHHLGQIRKEIIYLKLEEPLEKNTEITCEDQSSALVLSSVFYNNEIHALALKKCLVHGA